MDANQGYNRLTNRGWTQIYGDDLDRKSGSTASQAHPRQPVFIRGWFLCYSCSFAPIRVFFRVHSRFRFQGVARMPVTSGTIRELDRRAKILVWFGALVLKLLMRTIRCEVKDEAGFFDENAPKAVVALIWHNRMLGLTTAFSRHYPARKGALVLTSASRDGAYLAEFVRNFGVGSVRGSTSRRGSAALLDMVRKLSEGYDVCITPDGPRGPRYSLGPGAVLLAQLCKVPLMPLLI